MRSWLFLEGNKPGKLAKAPMVGADAVVIDLSVVPTDDSAPELRAEIAEWLGNYADPLIAKKAFARWVRIKPLDAPHWRDDLVVAMEGAPDGVMVPKITGPQQIRMLASEIYEIEQKLKLKHNSTKIVPQVGETAEAALTLGELTNDPQPRLVGFAWNADNVAKGLGARRTQREQGGWTDTMHHVRAMTIILARAMGVMAIETAAPHTGDAVGGERHAHAAKMDGFTGVAAVHPRQVKAIHEAYSMSAAERAEADTVIGLVASKQAAEPKLPKEYSAEVPAPEELPEPVEPRNIRAIG